MITLKILQENKLLCFIDKYSWLSFENTLHLVFPWKWKVFSCIHTMQYWSWVLVSISRGKANISYKKMSFIYYTRLTSEGQWMCPGQVKKKVRMKIYLLQRITFLLILNNKQSNEMIQKKIICAFFSWHISVFSKILFIVEMCQKCQDYSS